MTLDEDSTIDQNSTTLLSLYDILEHSDSTITAAKRVQWACSSLDDYKNCLSKCVSGRERSIRIISLLPWMVLCQKTNDKGFLPFISCKRSHFPKVQKKCGKIDKSSIKSTAAFCRNLSLYRRCYNRVTRNCTKEARKIWKLVDEALVDSYEKLLWYDANRTEIPKKCLWLRKVHRKNFAEQNVSKHFSHYSDVFQLPITVNSREAAHHSYVDYWILPDEVSSCSRMEKPVKESNFKRYEHGSVLNPGLNQDKRSVAPLFKKSSNNGYGFERIVPNVLWYPENVALIVSPKTSWMAPMSVHLVKGLNPSSNATDYSMDENAILRLRRTRTRIGRYDILFSKQQFAELQDSSDDNSDDELFVDYSVNHDSTMKQHRNKVVYDGSAIESSIH
uniref:DUF4801 domain-containing protein n=1 Tax=Syphacia muris TaxID=451379 RepID=A0A158R5K7_9BILA